jgi:membrane protease YdiL (CAAX protease family)
MHFENHDGYSMEPEPAPQETLPLPPSHSPRDPWTFRDLLLFLGFAILALVISNFVTLAAYAALRPIMGWPLSPEAIAQNAFFLLAAQLIFYVLIFAYVYLLVVFYYRLKFWDGIHWGRLTKQRLLRYIAVGIAVTVAVQLIPIFLPDKRRFPLERLFSSPESSYAVAAFAVVIAPFMEELIFRGVLFEVFELRVGLGFAIAATAVLFAAMHVAEYWGAWDHVFLIFLVGLAFSLTRGLTKSLAPSVVMHMTYNTCLMVGLFFSTSHFRVIQGWIR